MIIRSYQPEDEKAVIALWAACELTRPWNDPSKDIARKIASQPEGFLVGCQDEEVVATLMVGYEGHRGWVNYLAVAPGERQRGLGRKMMEEAELLLKAVGAPKLNLQIREDNAAALGFYRRLGYTQDDVLSFGKRLESDRG